MEKHVTTLIVIGGFAGAGKTTIATKLASDFSIPVYSSDVINDALRKSFKKSFHEMSPHAYETLWHLVRKQLSNGLNVILDANMAQPKTWESLDLLKRDMSNVQVLPIILEASLETHRSRIEERGRTNKDHLNLGGDKLEDVLHKYEFIKSLQRNDLIRVSADQEVNQVYSAILSILEEYNVIEQ